MRISGKLSTGAALLLSVFAVVSAQAQNAPLTISRTSVSLATAKKIVAAAEAEAVKNGWQLTFTILDDSGRLVYFQRMDEAPLGTIEVSQGKALTAVKFRVPTKMVQEMVTQGGPAMLTLGDITAVTGGR
jgi:glc operon protein GlcG